MSFAFGDFDVFVLFFRSVCGLSGGVGGSLDILVFVLFAVRSGWDFAFGDFHIFVFNVCGVGRFDVFVFGGGLCFLFVSHNEKSLGKKQLPSIFLKNTARNKDKKRKAERFRLS